MKKVLLFPGGLVDDNKWAKEFHNYDTTTRFKIDTGGAPNWSLMLTRVKEAAGQAGSGGVVLFLGGHGADADTTDPSSSWVSLASGGQVVLNPKLVFYKVDPDGNGPGKSAKDYDDSQIKEAESLKTPAGIAQYLQARGGMPADKQKEAMDQTRDLAKSSLERRQLYENYVQMGASLKNAKVSRVVFLSCRIGKDTKMIDQISKDWGVEVVAYKKFITLQEIDGKVRLFLSPTLAGDGAVRLEHDKKFIPDITPNTAHVAYP